MEIIKVTPRGYCKGVIRAITIAKETATKYPDQPIFVLGMLVHNQYVMEALKNLNIIAIDDKKKTRMELLDEINNGVVIFTAHGISDEVINKAKEKGLICVDASCPDVKKTQEIVKEHIRNGDTILYIGKQNHPEAEAVCSIKPEQIYLITSQNNIPKNLSGNIFVTNQTTMSVFDIKIIFEGIREIYPTATFSEEICNATRIRQEAIAAVALQEVDCLFVVGDKYSNNSNRLAQIAREKGIPEVFLIDTVQDIPTKQLSTFKKIAVTSGASTPTYLTKQVIEYLEDYSNNPTISLPKVDIDKIL